MLQSWGTQRTCGAHFQGNCRSLSWSRDDAAVRSVFLIHLDATGVEGTSSHRRVWLQNISAARKCHPGALTGILPLYPAPDHHREKQAGGSVLLIKAWSSQLTMWHVNSTAPYSTGPKNKTPPNIWLLSEMGPGTNGIHSLVRRLRFLSAPGSVGSDGNETHGWTC